MLLIRLLIIAGGFALLMLSMPDTSFAANTCGKLLRATTGDYLINTCNTCQNIQIVRSRGGGALPEIRDYRVEKGGRFALPFKGPGSTRIIETDACEPEAANARSVQRKVTEVTATCVLTAKLANGYVLLNRCPACRQTVIRWQYEDGGERNLPVTIDPRATLNVPRGIETGFSVIHEESCKS